MTYLLWPTVIIIFSFCSMFSFQYDACRRGANYGVRYQNFCHVELIVNDKFEPFFFKDAVEYCISNDGTIDSLFSNMSDKALLKIFHMAGIGRSSESNAKMTPSPRSFRSDTECSRSHTSKPGCAVVCAFKSCPLGTFEFPECRSKCRCEEDGDCDITTGSCSETGCTSGFFGPPFCRKCNCNRATQCDTDAGECLLGCKKGWGGESCQRWTCRVGECPPFARFGRSSVCETGWSGDECKTRLCQEGFFGLPDCNETCYCQNPEHCNVVDGDCGGNPCVAGRTGPQCSESAGNLSCPPFSYGPPNCSFNCFCYKNSPCVATTGLCPGICIPGWTGLSCDKRACRHGYYSYPECTKPCQCAVAEACNPLTGVCELENCELWNNCTVAKPSQKGEANHSVMWYLVLTIVISLTATVLLLLILCVRKPKKRAGQENAET